LAVFGTPGFIAPEQARGPAAALTPAADVYSLGAILFDLLAARPPFVGENALAVIDEAREKEAPKLRSLVPTVDRDVETICAKCLERDPRARYRSATDLAEDLERWLEGRAIVARPVSPPAKLWRWARRNRVLAGSVTVAIVAAGFAAARQLTNRELAVALQQQISASRVVAITPLLDLNAPAPRSEHASELAELLRQDPVLSTGSIRTPARGWESASPEELQRLAQQIGARFIVAGTTRTSHGTTRVALRAIDGVTGQALARHLEEAPDAADALRTSATALAVRLAVLLERREAENASPAPEAPSEAQVLIESGHLLVRQRTPSAIDNGIECFRRAVAADPGSAPAHAFLAIAQFGRASLGGPATLLVDAEHAAREAIRLDPMLAEGYRALGSVLYAKGDYPAALEQALLTLEMGGPQPFAAARIGAIHRDLGRPDRALTWFLLAQRWQVHPAESDNMIGDCWVDLGNDAEAEAAYRRVCRYRPELPDGWLGLLRLRLAQRDFAAANELSATELGRYGQFSHAVQIRAEAAFLMRDYHRAEELFRSLAEGQAGCSSRGAYGVVTCDSALGTIRYRSSDIQAGEAMLRSALATARQRNAERPADARAVYLVAALEATLGLRHEALQHLEEAFARGWVDYRLTSIDPRFDLIAADPRFTKIISDTAERIDAMRRSIPEQKQQQSEQTKSP
jgi:tetratricopeptide (TPR) repeat protein